MADRSREEVKIEEKIAAIKETMTRLGCSIKGEDGVLKSSQSVDEIEVGGDLLLDTWEGKKSADTWELTALLHSEREKVAALEKEVEDAQCANSELTAERNRLRSEARVVEAKLDRLQRDWESLQHKHQALERYSKELEDRQNSDPRIKALQTQQFTLELENVERTQMLRVKDEELSLLKTTLKQLREALQEKDKVISELSHTAAHSDLKRSHSEVQALKNQIARLNKELQSRPNAEECSAKDREIRLLLGEIAQLKKESGRRRCKSAGRLIPPATTLSSPRVRRRNLSHGTARPPPSRRQDADQCSTRRLSPTVSPLIQELIKLIGAKDPESLLVECRKVLLEVGELRDFAAVVSGTIREFSPPGAFAGALNLREMGKWVRRLVEEYLVLKSGHNETLAQLKILMHVKSSRDLAKAVTRQVADLNSMSEIVFQLKRGLDVDPHTSLEAVRDALCRHFPKLQALLP